MRVTVKVNNELIPHQKDETLVGSKEHQCLHAINSHYILLDSGGKYWLIVTPGFSSLNFFQTVHGSKNLGNK